MTPESTLEARLASSERRLNKRRRRLVQAILESADETYHLSSRALAERHGVDPATIVRTAQALGYDRFADFAADLRQHFVSRINPWFLAYTLRALGCDAEAPIGSAGSLLHRVRFLTDKDLVIAISFRKCLRETVDPVLRARTRGVRPSALPTVAPHRWRTLRSPHHRVEHERTGCR